MSNVALVTSQMCVVHPFFLPCSHLYAVLQLFFPISVLIGIVLHFLAAKPLGPCSLTSKDWIGLVGVEGMELGNIFFYNQNGELLRNTPASNENHLGFFSGKNSTALKSQPI